MADPGSAAADALVIESVCARLHERLDAGEAARAEEFVRQYYRRVPPEDLAERDPLDLYGAALAHRAFARRRTGDTPRVRVYNPEFEQHGWQSSHTVVELVSDDMPFLVDSVTMELSRDGSGIHLLIHPVLRVVRAVGGELEQVVPGDAPPTDGEQAESYILVEVDRRGDPADLEAVRERMLTVLEQVAAAVADHSAMRERAIALAQELEEHAGSFEGDTGQEAAALLSWMSEDHFLFLGYREYDLRDDTLHAHPDSGLGILRAAPGSQPPPTSLAGRSRDRAPERDPLVLTKANSRSTVHRPGYLDYVGVKRFDAGGAVVGERRFLGLYTSTAYRGRASAIPVVRRKVAEVVRRADFPSPSHAEKALTEILDTLPRDELFQITADQLFDIGMGILALGERQQVRLFVRPDAYERFVTCLVYMPRDRFDTDNRLRVQRILGDAFGADRVDFALRLNESVLVRIHFTVRVSGGLPEVDLADVEQRIVEATGSWTDDLRAPLLEEAGEEEGNALHRRYATAFPAAYREDWLTRAAVADIRRIERLCDDEPLAVNLYRPIESPDSALRCKLYRRGGPATLSDVLPMFQSMGLRVTDERPYEVTPADRPPTWIYDFGVEGRADRPELDVDAVRARFEDAFVRVWRGDVEGDGLNGLVLATDLDWRDVTVLRAVARYLRQARVPYSDAYMEQAVLAHPDVASALVALFDARMDPARGGDPTQGAAVAAAIERQIEAIASLDEDRILRSFQSVIGAMLRTNHFRSESEALAFKLDPSKIPLLPAPRPRFEIFVSSPRVEGVHLRGGDVARGGLRWSDRREDFRTEVLGLMKAQMVKNALIVPLGAKGGFVVKQPPADRDALRAEVVACYRTFIGSMLDLTDDVRDGQVLPPAGVVRHDPDDPYLVVAADKGTATFSDIANGIAVERGFWLGDAFASGGSVGYDHKAMGITARSAWESVKRHFRELGTDIQTEPFSVAGIGDMSGDVFGNGMLLSEEIRLVAAFDHRHVFLDPDPDAAASHAERSRMFGLERSSWDDYDRALISEGGGVWPRTAKAIGLSPQVQEALDVDAERLTPTELISAILRAPVDLLWNGGIGTYVKAASETAADVGDKANDAVRIDGTALRCRVVGEGGNLGFTQRGRIEFALAGGLVNTDAIDNAGGVNCSDHEVNIKVLLDAVVAAGDLTGKQRNALLEEMTDAVAGRVLRDSYLQTQVLSIARVQAKWMVDVHDRLMHDLEQSGRLDRSLEALPDAEALAERTGAGTGLTQPELAVLMAYAKITLYAALLESDLPEDPALAGHLEAYFPPPLPERYGDRLAGHRLRREIVATRVTNEIVDHAGLSFVFRLQEDTGASHADVARAHTVACAVSGSAGLWAQVEALDLRVPSLTQIEMLLEIRQLVERASRWLLRRRPRPLDIGAEVERFRSGADAIAEVLPEALAEDGRSSFSERAAALEQEGVPAELALRIAGLGPLFSAMDVAVVADATGCEIGEVAALHFAAGDRMRVHWLRDRIAALPQENRWQGMARAALRDDLFSLHADLTAEVLRGTSGDDADRLEQWIADHAAAVDRALGIIGEIQSGGVHDLTTLPVALRELRGLSG